MEESQETNVPKPDRSNAVKKERTRLYQVAETCTIAWILIGLPGTFIYLNYGNPVLYFVGVQLFGSLAILSYVALLLREGNKWFQRFIGKRGRQQNKTASRTRTKSEPLDNLEKLWAMKQSGAITQEEYNEAKRKLLGQISSE